MGKMIPVSGNRMVKVLQEVGFVIKRQKGSHIIMSDGNRIVVVPCHGNETYLARAYS
ncbi:MAG: type II toxin-antitoxin system HicA family toxin [Candidatus Stahlbacteria bacterium]|nr:type II toxin-antitoxin system HicA family toxin [Candidatus Stahlbacteria bacterium]